MTSVLPPKRTPDAQRLAIAIAFGLKAAQAGGRDLDAYTWKNPADAVDAFIRAGNTTIGGIAVILEGARYDQSKVQRVLVPGSVTRGLIMSGSESVLVVGFTDGTHKAVRVAKILRSPKLGDHHSVLID